MKASMKTAGRMALIGAAIAGTAAAAPPAAKQTVTGPVANYWLSAETISGLGRGGGGEGGRPSMGALMGMARGGGNVHKSLMLQLGSSSAPTGAPSAEHLPPAGLKVGASLPLLTPKPSAVTEKEDYDRPDPQSQQMPKGKMLFFWGCGEATRPGQPLSIDFAKLASGQVPPAYAQMMKTALVKPMQPPAQSRSKTYGEWPNEKTRTQVPAAGSLVGQHTIRGNYSPQIQFALNQSQDFLPAVQMTTNRKLPSGAFQLGWKPVTGATGYIAWAAGGNGDTVVMWTSSDVQTLASGMPDYMAPSEAARLVANKTLMPPSQTSCAVPKAVADVVPEGAMYQFTAYGDEANFSYPPRPADPKQAWNIEWTTKVRYRSATGGMLGMASPFGGGDDGEEAEGDAPRKAGKPAKKPGATDILRGLGGSLLGGL